MSRVMGASNPARPVASTRSQLPARKTSDHGRMGDLNLYSPSVRPPEASGANIYNRTRS